jgi:hypothetical protein
VGDLDHVTVVLQQAPEDPRESLVVLDEEQVHGARISRGPTERP